MRAFRLPAKEPGVAANQAGFTLLETLIAVAIMLVAFSSILMVESASINTSAKAKQMNIVAMLAKGAMVETEYKFEGKTFEEFKKTDGGNFPEPYADYRWAYAVKEIKFPNLGVGGGGGAGGDSSGQTQPAEVLAKLLTNFLSKAIREVQVSVIWKKGGGEQSYTISTYWVDLNHEFALSE